jgi:hypothetical protein
MRPYYITIWMYTTLFVIGTLLFVIAAYLGIRGDQSVVAIAFGGLSVASFLIFFIRQPVQALEENLEFISWLGVAFNTYWTQLMYLNNPVTIKEDLKSVTDDFSRQVARIIEKHAALREKRASIKVPDDQEDKPPENKPPVTPPAVPPEDPQNKPPEKPEEHGR